MVVLGEEVLMGAGFLEGVFFDFLEDVDVGVFAFVGDTGPVSSGAAFVSPAGLSAVGERDAGRWTMKGASSDSLALRISV
jgi:hypothetical protein